MRYARDTVRVAASTGVSTQDITFPLLGSYTPTDGHAVVVFAVSQADSGVPGGNPRDHAVHCRGITTGTLDYCTVFSSQDGRGVGSGTLSRTRPYSDQCFVVVGGNGAEVAAVSFDSWIPGGLRIAFDNDAAVEFLIQAKIVCGDAVNVFEEFRIHDTAEDGDETFSTGFSAVTCGFILGSPFTTWDGAINNNAVLCFGYFDAALSQASRAWIEETADTSPSASAWIDDRYAIVCPADYATTPPAGEVTGVSGGDVVVTKRLASTDFAMVLVALELPAGAWAGTLVEPGATGAHVFDEPEFTADSAMIDVTSTSITSTNELRTTTASAIGGWSTHRFDATSREFCTGWFVENLPSLVTNSGSSSADQIIRVLRHTGAIGIEADYVGPDADGFEVDFVQVLGTNLKAYPALVFEAWHESDFDVTLPALVASFDADLEFEADFAVELPPVVASFSAELAFEASFAVSLSPLVADFAAALVFESSFAVTLPPLTAEFAALLEFEAQFAVTLPPVVAELVAELEFEAAFAVTLAAVVAEFQVALVFETAFAVGLPPVVAAFAAELEFEASFSVVLPPVVAAFTAIVVAEVEVTFAAPLPPVVATFTATIPFPGTRTALPGSYDPRTALAGDLCLRTALAGGYALRAALPGDATARTALAGDGQQRVSLAGDFQT